MRALIPRCCLLSVSCGQRSLSIRDASLPGAGHPLKEQQSLDSAHTELPHTPGLPEEIHPLPYLLWHLLPCALAFLIWKPVPAFHAVIFRWSPGEAYFRNPPDKPDHIRLKKHLWN